MDSKNFHRGASGTSAGYIHEENFQIDVFMEGFQIKIFMWKLSRLIFSCGWFSDQDIHVEGFQIDIFKWRGFRSMYSCREFSDQQIHLKSFQIIELIWRVFRLINLEEFQINKLFSGFSDL